MPDLDHEQFEGYLKQFQPLAPEALPVEVDRRETRRVPALVMWAAAAAVIVVAVTAGVQHRLRLTGNRTADDVDHRHRMRARGNRATQGRQRIGGFA